MSTVTIYAELVASDPVLGWLFYDGQHSFIIPRCAGVRVRLFRRPCRWEDYVDLTGEDCRVTMPETMARNLGLI